MKEITLNADFGMTASDDGFALYGIHTGDMIMFKAAEDFPTNGSLVAVSIDDGPVTLKRINFHDASMTCYLEGGSGKVPTIAHPEATVEVEHALFQCGACGKLERRLAVTLKAPEQVRILQRCDCGKAMRRIRAGKDMVCPECKRPLEATNLVAVTMWD